MDLTSEFYRFLRSNSISPVELPKVGTIAEFEEILAEVDRMTDADCRLLLVEALKLLLTQQKMLQELMKPKL